MSVDAASNSQAFIKTRIRLYSRLAALKGTAALGPVGRINVAVCMFLFSDMLGHCCDHSVAQQHLVTGTKISCLWLS